MILELPHDDMRVVEWFRKIALLGAKDLELANVHVDGHEDVKCNDLIG